MTAKPPAHEGILTTEEVLEYLQTNLLTKMLEREYHVETAANATGAVNLRVAGYLTKPLRDTQMLEAAARALGAPAA